MANSICKNEFSARKFLTKNFFLVVLFCASTLFSMAHTITGYSGTCGSGPIYSIQPHVTNVNSGSNYAWQFRTSTSGAWTCIVGSSFTVNSNTYNVTGATSTATVSPASLVITNPNSGLQGVIFRCLISDGAGVNPCNMPAGNSWTSLTADDHVVNVTGTACYSTSSCSCPNNLVLNPSFENGTANWSWSGGNFNAGSGAVACGSYSGDFQITNNASNWVSQTIGTDLPVGTTVNAKTYAGTHDNSFYHSLRIEFFDASWNYISASTIEVNKVLSAAPVGPQLYSWSAVVPAGTKYTNIAFNGNGNWIKTDNWCVTTTSPTTGSIGDKVWFDANGNGLQDATETTGITGVTVQLKNSTGTVIQTTTTNASGNYLFSGLAAGNYTVVFPTSISGAVVTTQNVGTNDNIDSDADQTTGATGTITLATGQNIINVDAGYCPTTLALGNRVWNDVNNNSLNDGENGIGSVVLNLYKDNDNNNVADGAAIATTSTDVNGYYLFSNLAPGNYIVGAVTPAGFTSSTINGGDPDNDINLDDNGQETIGNETRGLAITLVAGTEPDGTNTNTNTNITYDFGFYATPTGSIGNFVFGDANGNGIQDAGEVGIASVPVTLYRDANGDCIPDGVAVATVSTDVNGFYTFNGLSAGNYMLVFPSIAGYNPSPQNVGTNDNVDSDIDPATGNACGVLLAAGQNRTDIDAGYCPSTLALGDRVFYDDNNDGYRQDAELGIPGVTVYLYRDNNNDNVADGAAIASTTTNGTGNYRFDGLLPGNYIVGVIAPAGYNSSTISGVDPDNDVDRDDNGNGIVAGEVRGNAITLTGGAEPLESGYFNNTYDFGFYRALGSIGNRVWLDADKDGIQDAGEVGLAGVTVSLFDATGSLIATTVTDGLGNYRFSNLPITETGVNYSVGFTLPAQYSYTALNANGGGLNNDLNSDANITTGKTGTITLTYAAPNVDYVDAGVYYNAPNRIGDFIWNDLNGNGAQDAGEPGIAGVTVTLYNSAGVAVKTTITDNNGYYRFDDVAPGTYTLGITQPAGFSLTTANNTTDDKDSDFDVNTSRTAAFTVTATTYDLTFDAGLKADPVTQASVGDRVWNDLNNNGIQDAGEPGVPGVTVTLYNSAGAPQGIRTTDAFGNYIFNNLNPGDYYVVFSGLPAGYNFVTAGVGTDRNVDSDANATTGRTANFSLGADQNRSDIDAGIRNTSATAVGSIGDFVWYDTNKNGIQDAGEVGVPGVTVVLLDATTNAIVKTTTTNTSGFYLFTDLPNGGSYILGFTDIPSGFDFTSADMGASDALDSDVNPNTKRTGIYTINTASAATKDIRTVDAGIVSNPGVQNSRASIGDKVWNDLNGDGQQDANEPGIAGVTVTLYDGNGNVIATTTTDGFGNYIFTNLSAGSYQVGFSNLPSGYVFTTANSGNDNSDSDANTTTGRTSVFTLLSGEVNLTVDAGIRNTVAKSALGDRVWYDLNNNGLQDAGEPGVPGVSVFLINPTTNSVIKNTVTNANGEYLFTDLDAGNYIVGFQNYPGGYTPTAKDATGFTAGNGSDVDAATGRTAAITLGAGVTDLNWDLGIVTATKAGLGDYVWYDANGNGRQDAGESPAQGITVTLYNSANVAIATTVTDANGGYFFSNLDAGTYSVGFSNLPANASFTGKNAAGSTGANGSDVNEATGRTDNIVLVAGQVNRDVDAGLVTRFAAVGNYVWNDLNSNGLQDAGEPGVAGVVVTLKDAAGNTVASAVTDGNGQYFINNIPVPAACTNFYVIFSNKPTGSNFTPRNVGGAAATNNSKAYNSASGTIVAGQTDQFTLCPGDVNLTIDGGLIVPASLPVSLVRFDGALVGNVAKLNWVASNEVNLSAYQLERSKDGVTFSPVANVAARGTNGAQETYNQDDNLAGIGVTKVYYRLRMIDNNGAAKISNIVIVRLGGIKISNVYPNPFVESIRVELEAKTKENAQVRIVDMNGKVVVMQQAQLQIGGNQFTINGLSRLAKGTYVIEVITSTEKLIEKLNKQ
jgi:SdrD B-like domain/Secretion system C-terminal sorting domain